MTLGPAIFIVVMSFITAAISGVFGMAGGLLLKGSLALVLGRASALVRAKCDLCGGRDDRRVRLLPFSPQQEGGKREHDEQDDALGIHGCFWA